MGRLGSTPHACDLFHSRPEPLTQGVTRAARGREVARARKGFGKRARAVQQPKVSMVSLETRAVLTSTGSTYVDQVVHRLGFRAGEPSSSTALVTSVVLVLALCATTEQQDTEVLRSASVLPVSADLRCTCVSGAILILTSRLSAPQPVIREPRPRNR